MKKPEQLFENLYLIDDFDLKMEERTGSYLLAEPKLTLIETSASPSVPFILDGLRQLGYSGDDIKYIIVTHIHLDHAGGAGLLLEHCPNASIVVHPRGARHLKDPARLIAGAKAVYGNKFDELFSPIIPIPEDRIITKSDEDTLEIGNGNTLVFYDTPGHANHHFSIYFPKINGMFTGDTAGVFYPQLERDGVELYLPSTTPNQFNPEKMLQSIQRFDDLNLDCILFGHYGMSRRPNEVYRQLRFWIPTFVEESAAAFGEGGRFEDQVNRIEKKLQEKISAHLLSKGISGNHRVYDILSLDISVCAMGLADYFSKSD